MAKKKAREDKRVKIDATLSPSIVDFLDKLADEFKVGNRSRTLEDVLANLQQNPDMITRIFAR